MTHDGYDNFSFFRRFFIVSPFYSLPQFLSIHDSSLPRQRKALCSVNCGLIEFFIQFMLGQRFLLTFCKEKCLHMVLGLSFETSLQSIFFHSWYLLSFYNICFSFSIVIFPDRDDVRVYWWNFRQRWGWRGNRGAD